MKRLHLVLTLIAAIIGLADVAGLGLLSASALMSSPSAGGRSSTAVQAPQEGDRATGRPAAPVVTSSTRTEAPTTTPTGIPPTRTASPTPTPTPVPTPTPTPVPFQRSVVNVSAREQRSLIIGLLKGDTLEGSFTVQGSYDINFRVTGVPGSASVFRRVKGDYAFRWPVTDNTTLTLVFDNSYSLLTAKQISLRYRIVR